MKHAYLLAATLMVACVSVPAVDASASPQDASLARSAAGPSVAEAAPPPATLSWLAAYRFHLTAANVRTDDPRFDWDAHFGGDVDLLDYGFGRLNLLADYEVMIGSQLRTIDPNQGAYRLDVSASVRSGQSELQGVFHHVSRHLSDRANTQAVSWNAVGASVTARYAGRATVTAVSISGAKVVQAAFVDYTWQFGVLADSSYRLSPRAALIGRAEVSPMLVDARIASRGTQVGARVEGGVRLSGTGAGLELFAALERRVDPYPLERATRNWALLGFRFVSR